VPRPDLKSGVLEDKRKLRAASQAIEPSIESVSGTIWSLRVSTKLPNEYFVFARNQSKRQKEKRTTSRIEKGKKNRN